MTKASLRSMVAELHVHTVLSPCAEIEMIPPLIVERALAMGADIIAVTDHNASSNVRAVQKAAEESRLKVLPGMELQTREEVHLLCLFDASQQLDEFQRIVDGKLPAMMNRPEYFGEQFVVDETGEFLRREDRLLLTSANMSLAEAVAHVKSIGGLAIPAHVDRKAFSLIANLGFVPTDVEWDALEISRHLIPERAGERLPAIAGYPLVQNGDVHRLDEFLCANVFRIASPTVEEMRLALQGRKGRALCLQPPASSRPRFPIDEADKMRYII